MWALIGLIVSIIILGVISFTVEQERDKEFREQNRQTISKLAEWWYDKKYK